MQSGCGIIVLMCKRANNVLFDNTKQMLRYLRICQIKRPFNAIKGWGFGKQTNDLLLLGVWGAQADPSPVS